MYGQATLQESVPSRASPQVLPQGVAFHNGDLDPDQRSIVERAFTCGALRGGGRAGGGSRDRLVP